MRLTRGFMSPPQAGVVPRADPAHSGSYAKSPRSPPYEPSLRGEKVAPSRDHPRPVPRRRVVVGDEPSSRSGTAREPAATAPAAVRAPASPAPPAGDAGYAAEVLAAWRCGSADPGGSSGRAASGEALLPSLADLPEREVKTGALAGLPLAPDAAAVPVHDPPDRRQPDARPLELGRGVEALEDAEELRCVGHVEPGAVVADEVHRLAVLLRRAELDARVGPAARELPRVAEEVLEGCAEQGSIAGPREPVADDEFDVAVRLGLAQSLERRPREPGEVHRRAAQVHARETSQREQAVDERRHPLGRLADAVQVKPRGRAELAAVVLEQRAAEAVDRAQGRAQIVGDRVVERLEVAVRRLGGLAGGVRLRLGALAVRDVARDDGRAGEGALHVVNWGDGDRDVHVATVLA